MTNDPYKYSEQDDNDLTSLLEKARALQRQGDLTTAGSICTQILHHHPENANAMHLQGLIFYQQGNADQAVTLLANAIAAKPTDLNIYKNLILMLKQMGQMAVAASYCNKALCCNSQNYQIYQKLGSLFFIDGYPEHAIACYEKALAINSKLDTVWGNLGNVLQGCRKYDEAMACYEKALVLNPICADLYYNIGVAYSLKEMFDRAVSNFEKALVLDPDHVQALFNLGNALKAQGRMKAAVKYYQKCLRINPDDIDARHNMANTYYAQGQQQAAMDAYSETLQRKPDHFLAMNNLACLFKDMGADDQAVSLLRKSIEIAPDDMNAYVLLGHIHKERNAIDDAFSVYRKALSLSPDHHDVLMYIGRLLKQTGRYEEGIHYLKQAVAHSPDISNSWWYYYLSLPVLYDTPADIQIHRQRLSDGMSKLIHNVRLDTPQRCKRALEGIGSFTNFYLQYQGQNDIDLQRKYGDFVHNIMAANFSQWAAPLSMPALQKSGKIRVGYLSSFMRSHTVGHFLMGWLEHHDRMKLEIYGYYIGDQTDELTEAFKQKTDQFYHISGNIEAVARQIRDDALHILVFTDIGMFAPATQLAGLRLAPIQCKGWGHPVTTGLPTIDYYLSSDLMEAQDAEAHYTEKLVRLPNLALALKSPKIPEKRKPRQAFGLSDDDFIFFTSQSLFKYLPQFDEIYPKIAAQVKNAKFVFISHPNPAITQQFRKRMEKAFYRENLSIDRFCVFQPRLSTDDFIHLNMVSDVLLDPFLWSGGKTTLEGLSCGLPVVTCPGAFMRGRHAYAMLKRMDTTETIASDVTSYVAIACRLANDKFFYHRVRNDIISKSHRLFNDKHCIQHLETFYRSIVKAQLFAQDNEGREK